MAKLDGNLWQYNFAKIVILDVSDDYELMRDPLPNCCYPVIAEMWVPRYKLPNLLPLTDLVDGYLYDWHQSGPNQSDPWMVGMVRSALAESLLSSEYGIAH